MWKMSLLIGVRKGSNEIQTKYAEEKIVVVKSLLDRFDTQGVWTKAGNC